jgi:hypothetical protein
MPSAADAEGWGPVVWVSVYDCGVGMDAVIDETLFPVDPD